MLSIVSSLTRKPLLMTNMQGIFYSIYKFSNYYIFIRYKSWWQWYSNTVLTSIVFVSVLFRIWPYNFSFQFSRILILWALAVTVCSAIGAQPYACGVLNFVLYFRGWFMFCLIYITLCLFWYPEKGTSSTDFVQLNMIITWRWRQSPGNVVYKTERWIMYRKSIIVLHIIFDGFYCFIPNCYI
jgi:hypothetical protein